MGLNTIKGTGNWGGAASDLNNNFATITAEIEKLKAANVKFKGYYTSEATLKAVYSSPAIGDNAWVGATYPGTVYECKTARTWSNTGKAPSTPSVQLADYATKTLVDVRTTEYNVSVQHPTSGIDSTNKYTLSGAVALVPSPLRTVGLKCSFLGEAGIVETWEYQGGVFTNVRNWVQQVRRAEIGESLLQMQAGSIINLADDNNTLFDYYINAYGDGGVYKGYRTTKKFPATDKIYSSDSTRALFYKPDGSFEVVNPVNGLYQRNSKEYISCQVVFTPNNIIKHTPIVSNVFDIRDLELSDLNGIIRKNTISEAVGATFIELFLKRLNSSDVICNGYVGSTGGVSSDSGWRKTDYIDCSSNITYLVSNKVCRYAFYDENKLFLQNLYRYNIPAYSNVVINSNAKYVIICGQFTDDENWIVIADTEIIDAETLIGIDYLPRLKRSLLKTKNDPIIPELFLPNKIFVCANNIVAVNIGNNGGRNRSYGAALYLDRMFNVSFLPALRFRQTHSDRHYFYAETEGAANNNFKESDINIDVIGDAEISFTIKQIQVNATNGASDRIRLLCIGDSVTNGTGAAFQSPDGNQQQYWHILNKLFLMDRIDSNNNSLYNFKTVGWPSNRNESFIYNDKTTSINSYAEGRGGWKATDYAYEEYAIDTGTGTNTKVNPFYDGSKAGVCKFSLRKYLERYRTVNDDTEEIESGTDPKGGYVCTPTHIIFQLGTNDSDLITMHSAIKNIIDNIREEGYSNIKIAIGIPALPRTLFPELYPDIIGNKVITSATNTFYDKAKKLMELDGYDDNVVFVPIYFVMPTAEGIGYRDIGNLFMRDSIRAVSTGHVPDLHPNAIAHAAFAQQYYSWIKWTFKS